MTNQSQAANNLGFTFDLTIFFYQHVKEITKFTYFPIRNKANIRSFLFMVDAEILSHAFVSFRLDYSYVLWSGLPHAKCLQMVQNTES